jgi:transcriptional regulator with XRE-family HTH domain
MTPQSFRAWRKGLGMSQREAAEALGISMSSVQLYERGSRREDGRPVEIPKTVALACSAVSHRLPPME